MKGNSFAKHHDYHALNECSSSSATNFATVDHAFSSLSPLSTESGPIKELENNLLDQRHVSSSAAFPLWHRAQPNPKRYLSWARAWFIVMCFAFIFLSSLPRLCTIIDAVVNVILYILWHKRHLNVSESLWHSIWTDVIHFDATRSASLLFIVVISSLVRSIVLFYFYAYSRHTRPYTLPVTTTVSLISLIFTLISLYINDADDIAALLYFNLAISSVEILVFMTSRRQRIKSGHAAALPRRTLSRASIAEHFGENQPLKAISVVNNDVNEELLPVAMADGDSIFLPVGNLLVHCKAIVNGKPVVMQSSEQNQRISQLRSLISKANYSDYQLSALLCLHGFTCDLTGFRHVSRDLGNIAAVVFMFDRPGFGLTTRPIPDNAGHFADNENPYSSVYSVALIVKLMDLLGIEKAALLGLATGGMLAMYTAVTYRHRFIALLLVAPCSEGFSDAVKIILATNLGESLLLQLVRSEIGEMAIKRAWNTKVPREVILRHKMLTQQPGYDASLVALVRAPTYSDLKSQLDLLENMPCLIIHGLRDKIVAYTESERLVQTLHNANVPAQLIGVDECGHALIEEVPEVLIECINAFMMSSMYKTHSKKSTANE